MIRKSWPICLISVLLAFCGASRGAARMLCSECACIHLCTTSCIDDDSGLASACVNTGICSGSPACYGGGALQARSSEQLQEAIFAPAGAAPPDSVPAPELKLLCSPLPDDICIYYQCECAHQCGLCGGISSFTCNSNTGVHSCKCKTC